MQTQSKNDKEEKVLDGIVLAPEIKFQTIMKTFNQLKEGEGFILHNDHDPKPLYFKLISTHGEIFTWDYLKQGPDIFDIRIAKKALSSKNKTEKKPEIPESISDDIVFDDNAPETVRTITAKDYRTAAVFKRYGIDYGWKGDRSLKEVCHKTDITETILRQELDKVSKDFSGVVPSQDYYHWDMDFLTDYVLHTHHRYVKDNAERISTLAEDVAEEHGKEFPELVELGKDVRPMIDDFMVHMSKEEDVLFPAIKQMLKQLQKGDKKEGPGGAIANAIAKMEAEHDETRKYLEHFRTITHQYQLPVEVCDSQQLLYHELQMFENDTYLHVHLENNILFPKTVILERKLTKG